MTTGILSTCVTLATLMYAAHTKTDRIRGSSATPLMLPLTEIVGANDNTDSSDLTALPLSVSYTHLTLPTKRIV